MKMKMEQPDEENYIELSYTKARENSKKKFPFNNNSFGLFNT